MRKFFVSPCEKYVLFDFAKPSGESYLYELETMKMIRKFEYPYLWDFTMVKDDDPVAEDFYLLHVVRRIHDGRTVSAKLLYPIEDIITALRVYCHGRLV